ncbi:MAG TPA: alkaline phosphatase family protein [Candidatus Saccharimonadales bacterium]|nr:alkaline phosphatase family protein [Candidatus Saccharimonadales bacterium]
MNKKKGLVIIHIDGLGCEYFKKALEDRIMPFTQELIDKEDYEIVPYYCGLPSTTPYCQAGILYGDNREIPSFRWWDKEAGFLIEFGLGSSFEKVSHKYFQSCKPLIKDGACIAACYPAGAKETFGLAYRTSNGRALFAWGLNPFHYLVWLIHGIFAILRFNRQLLTAEIMRQKIAWKYVYGQILEDIFLHNLTLSTIRRAMRDGFPIIYGGFYAYDETAHAFGPTNKYCQQILHQTDLTIKSIASFARKGIRDYDVVVLSDHGQVETSLFMDKTHNTLGEYVSEWLPTFEVEECPGRVIKTAQNLDGHLIITYSGGLGHLYFKDISWRMKHSEIEKKTPGLIAKIANLEQVEAVITFEDKTSFITTKDVRYEFSQNNFPKAVLNYLSKFAKADEVAKQILKLNSFERSGDMILLGKYSKGKQVNFENQIGGHGSLGGEQMKPFILVKKDWGFAKKQISDATELYSLLKSHRG